jgi:hypothetical protein
MRGEKEKSIKEEKRRSNSKLVRDKSKWEMKI